MPRLRRTGRHWHLAVVVSENVQMEAPPTRPEAAARGQVLVVEPAVRFANLDCLNQLALASPLPVSYHLPALYGFASLEAVDLERVRGLILLGSATSPNDSLAWQDHLRRWLKDFVRRGLPILGICYGHQLLAQLFGARIGFAFPGNAKAHGFRRVRLEGAPEWAGGDGELELCVSHREAVLETPPSLRVFARSDAVAVEGFAHAELPVFGLQAHPEATPVFLAQHDLAAEGAAGRLAGGRRLVRGFLEAVATWPAR